MYCQHCGALNDDDASFCVVCGALCDGAPPNPYAAPAFSTQEVVHDYLVPNIVITILSCWSLGIFGPALGLVGICLSTSARNLKSKGKWEEARAKASIARIFFWVVFGAGLTFAAIGLVVRAVLFFRLK